MTDRSLAPALQIDRAGAFAWFSLAAGAASALLLIVTLQPLPRGPTEQLAFFADHRGSFVLMAVVVLIWSVFSMVR